MERLINPFYLYNLPAYFLYFIVYTYRISICKFFVRNIFYAKTNIEYNSIKKLIIEL